MEQLTGLEDISALSALAQEPLLDGLTEALRLSRTDLPAHTDRVIELLEDAADRVKAWQLTRLRERDEFARIWRLPGTVLARAGGEPRREWQLIPFGQIELDRPLAGASFEFTRAHAEAAVAWFECVGRKLAIDYEHQSLDALNTRPDGLSPAAGWIGGLEVRDDGLWATQVEWTPRAAELLRSGEYRYFSPVIYWADDQAQELAGLGPVALTNDPAMHNVMPLAARRRPVQPAERVVANAVANAEAADAADEPRRLRRALESAEREAAVLRRQIETHAADAFVERGMRLGKISDATSLDWRDDYLRDSATAEQRLKRAAVVVPQGRLTQRDEPEASASRPTPRGGAEFEPEDLLAYERAVAAGRVRRVGD